MPFNSSKKFRSSHGRGGNATQKEQYSLSTWDLTQMVKGTTLRRRRAQCRSLLIEPDGMEEARETDLILEGAFRYYAQNQVEIKLVRLIKEYLSNDISGLLRCKVRRLQDRFYGGSDRGFTRMIVGKTLLSKQKQLCAQQGSMPGTPESSDDEKFEETDDGDNADPLDRIKYNEIVKVEGNNISDVTETPKPEKTIKAEQVTTLDDKALQTNEKNYKILKNHKEDVLAVLWDHEAQPCRNTKEITKPAASMSTRYLIPSAAEVFKERRHYHSTKTITPPFNAKNPRGKKLDVPLILCSDVPDLEQSRSSALSLLESNTSWKCTPVDMGNKELRIKESKKSPDDVLEDANVVEEIDEEKDEMLQDADAVEEVVREVQDEDDEMEATNASRMTTPISTPITNDVIPEDHKRERLRCRYRCGRIWSKRKVTWRIWMREGIPWNQMEVVQDGGGHFSDCRDKIDGREISTVIPAEEMQKSLSARTAIGHVVDDHQFRNEPLTDETLKKCRRQRKSSVEGVLKKCKKKIVVKEEVTIFFYKFSQTQESIIRKKGNAVLSESLYKKKTNSTEFILRKKGSSILPGSSYKKRTNILRKKGSSILPGSSYKKKTNSKDAYDDRKIMFPQLQSQSMLNLSISNCHDIFFPSSFESSLLDDDIEYFFIPKIKYRNRKRKLRSWQRIQSVPAGKERLPAEKDQNTNQGRKNRTRKKGTGRHLKRKPKTERVFTKPTIHSGPRYNISKMELKRAYKRMRKGNRFHASWNVLWKPVST